MSANNAAEAVRARLVADTAVAALVGTRVFIDEAPDKAALPLIVYGVRLQEESDGSAPMSPASIEIHCYAATDDGAKSLADAADAALATPGLFNSGTRVLAPSLEDWDSVRDAEMAIWGRLLRYGAFVVRG